MGTLCGVAFPSAEMSAGSYCVASPVSCNGNICIHLHVHIMCMWCCWAGSWHFGWDRTQPVSAGDATPWETAVMHVCSLHMLAKDVYIDLLAFWRVLGLPGYQHNSQLVVQVDTRMYASSKRVC